MADEPRDPDAAADRLEAALERIARLAAGQAARIAAAETARVAAEAARKEAQQALAANKAMQDSALSIPEIAERLDSLIGRLRSALGKPQ